MEWINLKRAAIIYADHFSNYLQPLFAEKFFRLRENKQDSGITSKFRGLIAYADLRFIPQLNKK